MTDNLEEKIQEHAKRVGVETEKAIAAFKKIGARPLELEKIEAALEKLQAEANSEQWAKDPLELMRFPWWLQGAIADGLWELGHCIQNFAEWLGEL